MFSLDIQCPSEMNHIKEVKNWVLCCPPNWSKYGPCLVYECIWSGICSCFAGSKWIWAREQRWESFIFSIWLSCWFGLRSVLVTCDSHSLRNAVYKRLLKVCISSGMFLSLLTFIPWFHVCRLRSGLLVKDGCSNTDSVLQMTVRLSGRSEGIPLEINTSRESLTLVLS